MSSTILYKFRSGTTFEALPLPGSAARLFDVKKAIVAAKKLDQGGSTMEFDLSVRDATTNEEYADESMLLPRGTRVVVQRLPAARGHGFLARMARAQYGFGGGGGAPNAAAAAGTTPSNFYTIDTAAQDEDEEFISSTAAGGDDDDDAEEKELAALRAATEAANSANHQHVAAAAIASRSMRGGRGGGGGPAGRGPPPPPPSSAAGHQRGGPGGAGAGNFRQRLNADPELREQEKQSMPKKRATGIPRTFLSLSAPPPADGADGAGTAGDPVLQPNKIGFADLVHRGGGQSENIAGTKRDLDYALKLTATTIPEYLQCAICNSLVKDATILPWDPEGRTTCDACVRDALNQNGFQCPLTGQEGVSPDDLLPNFALRKAAEQFLKGVMEKVDEIEQQQVDEDEGDDAGDSGAGEGGDALVGDNAEKGVLMSRRTSLKMRQQDDDPFGGEDDFGGDVFAVETEAPADKQATENTSEKAPSVAETNGNDAAKESGAPANEDSASPGKAGETGATPDKVEEPAQKAVDSPAVSHGRSTSPPRDAGSSPQDAPHTASGSSRREAMKRRGPPMGYTMGPAGGAAVAGPTSAYADRDGEDRSSRYDGGRAPYRGGRGDDRSGRYIRGGRYNARHDGPVDVSLHLSNDGYICRSLNVLLVPCLVCSSVRHDFVMPLCYATDVL